MRDNDFAGNIILAKSNLCIARHFRCFAETLCCTNRKSAQTASYGIQSRTRFSSQFNYITTLEDCIGENLQKFAMRQREDPI